MATSRLTFLYPHLYRTGRWTEPTAVSAVAARRSRRRPPTATSPSFSCQHVAPFTTPSVGRQAPFPKRHGKAVEPMPLPALESHQSAEANKPAEQTAQGGQEDGQERKPAPDDRKSDVGAAESQESTPKPSHDNAKGASGTAKPEPPPDQPGDGIPPEDIGRKAKGTSGPMDTILHMGPPPSSGTPSVSYASDSTKDPQNGLALPGRFGPHLHPPPYVHHFDTYSLVKQLSSGGYTLNQSITAMKAVRGLLAANLDVAQSSLVSKSDVENESYLFRAACSELSTEVRNNQRVADEQLRQQRTLLQHEVDILTQHLNQELLTLNDNVRGMFNDRRMAVREEQKAVDSRIQQILYKISVMLNSDMKSEIEALRWVLIRRSVIGIVCLVVLTFGTLRYASYVSHERKKEAERLRREREREIEEGRKQNGKLDNTSAPDAAEILAAA
ncbi:hypothetical protein QBC34DRAFT_444669 [Podospora aff. communis PSN243]|uniref:MOZ protein represents a chromatin-associated acetyltransferase n=1 Tax=Podospora aff. communis PSN243 TaxID=3040156 RepID=A0AAV9H8M7_9PEZI|nr:hypothetical protein QBC34DRAFT_444669 [Podospora aff. communis PSN243]